MEGEAEAVLTPALPPGRGSDPEPHSLSPAASCCLGQKAPRSPSGIPGILAGQQVWGSHTCNQRAVSGTLVAVPLPGPGRRVPLDPGARPGTREGCGAGLGLLLGPGQERRMRPGIPMQPASVGNQDLCSDAHPVPLVPTAARSPCPSPGSQAGSTVGWCFYGTMVKISGFCSLLSIYGDLLSFFFFLIN